IAGKEEGAYRFVVVKKNRGYLLVGEKASDVIGGNDRYRKLALYDQLTELPNEHSLKEYLDSFDRRRRFSLVLFAVDDFESIQTTIGREYSKEFIEKLIQYFNSKMDKEDMMLFHFGEDRFCIFLKNVLHYNTVESWTKSVI